MGNEPLTHPVKALSHYNVLVQRPSCVRENLFSEQNVGERLKKPFTSSDLIASICTVLPPLKIHKNTRFIGSFQRIFLYALFFLFGRWEGPWRSGQSCLLGKSEIAGSNPTLTCKFFINRLFLSRSRVILQYYGETP